MALPSAYAIPTLASTFLVFAGESVYSTLMYSQLKCVRCRPHLVPPYHALLFHIPYVPVFELQ